jgi:hypothetical protein
LTGCTAWDALVERAKSGVGASVDGNHLIAILDYIT